MMRVIPCAAGALLFAVSACKKPEAAAPPPPVVEVMRVERAEVPLSTNLIGQLDSPQNVEVRARVEAFVDKMLFVEGSEVEKGQLLFRLDEKPFLEQLAAAQGALGEAKAALHKYETDVKRLAPLVEARAIPKQDLDNAEAAVEVGVAGLATAEAQVKSAEIDLGYCTIHAPTAGLIGAKQVSIGELVGKGEPTLLATISTLDPIWFYCNVSEVDYLKAQEKTRQSGMAIESVPLTLVLPDGTEHPDQGRFVFIDRAVDVKTGTLRVRAEFPNKAKLLRPGMFARVKVDLGTRKDCIVIPERAIVQVQGKTFAWVVDGEGKATQRAVDAAEQVGPGFIITSGLEPGDKIIVEGIQKAREGAPVTAMTAAEMNAPKAKP